MNYSLLVVQLLFLLITVFSAEQCHERNIIQVTGGLKESSQNGFYYGIISTPGFPQPFRTPFRQSWVIDASHAGNGTQINLYLTQMYLVKGVKFFQYPSYKFCEGGIRKPGPRQECHKSDDWMNPDILKSSGSSLHDLIKVQTSCPYLEIQVDVPTLYGDHHYRTKDPFLFFVYGFNITFEIVPAKLGVRNDSCYARNCSNLGHCYLAENWSDFFCDCVKDHPGRYCEFSPYCDPENNITFCHNGGKCKLVGSNNGYCDCAGTGFGGPHCDKRKDFPKVSARVDAKGCSKTNDCPSEEIKPRCSSSDSSRAPCSCHPSPGNGIFIPNNWTKYEAIISFSRNYNNPRNYSVIENELHNLTSWFKARNLPALDRLSARISSSRGDNYPQELQIHFHGPISANDSIFQGLSAWLLQRQGYSSREQIPLLQNTLFLQSMPRVAYKSIEVSKQSRLKIGKTVSLTCTAITGPSDFFVKRDIRFRWFKDKLPINTSLASRPMSIGELPPNDNATMSILIVHDVSPFDGGRYSCEITDLAFGDQSCGEEDVEVVLPPQIEIEPMSLTLEKQNLELGVVITCTDGSTSVYSPHNKSREFIWYRSGSRQEVVNDNGPVVSEDIIPQGKLLRIFRAEHSESFTCVGFSKEGEERSKAVEVKVLDSKYSPSCKREWERLAKQPEKEKSLLWEWTAPNSVAMIPCPKGFIGYVQRQCILYNGKGQWGRSDFSRCLSNALQRVNSTLQNAKRGFGDWHDSNAAKLMGLLEKYLDKNRVLYAGEGEKIVVILEDIVKYAFGSEKTQVNGLFGVFFRTVVKFLKIPNSCVQEKSILTLTQVVEDMATRGAMQVHAESNSKSPHTNPSEVLLLQTLPISAQAKYRDLSYIFPQHDTLQDPILSWLKDKLYVNFPLDSEGLPRDAKSPEMYYLIMAAYKNLSFLSAPNDMPTATSSKGGGGGGGNYRSSIELISPVVHISIPGGYYLPPDSHIKIHFNLSKEHRSLVSQSAKSQAHKPGATMNTGGSRTGVDFICGMLDNSSISTKTDYGRLRWNTGAQCSIDFRHETYVECQCKDLGIFGLLKVTNLEDEIHQINNNFPEIIVVGFSFCMLSCVVTAAILCTYLKCRISLSTFYTLKILDCFAIFSASLLLLVGRTEMSSWFVWSATACSFLIGSISIQITKALRVLLTEAKPYMAGFVFPWLRNVSQITLLSAITFSTVLPVWTGTVAKIISQDTSNESAFKETSHVFVIFVGTVGLVVLIFLAIYYKAVLKIKREIDGYRNQIPPCSASSSFNSDMIWMLTYRKKTLNRSLCLTLVLLVMTLAIILFENIPRSTYIQYFLGLSATAMGVVLFLSYVTHSEYPLLNINLCSRKNSEKPLRPDPEKDSQPERNGSQRKLQEITANGGSNFGTTELLPHSPPPPPKFRNPSRYFESESNSTSTAEEQSMYTMSTQISSRTKKEPLPVSSRNSHFKSGSNTLSSGGSSISSKHQRVYSGKRPDPVVAYITGEYVLPDNHNTTTTPR